MKILPFSSQEPEHLLKYLPIHQGGLKFLAGLIVMLVLLANSLAVLGGLEEKIGEASNWNLVLGGAAGAACFALFVYVKTGWRGEWLHAYQLRNVHGRVLRVSVPNESNEPRWYAEVVPDHAVTVSWSTIEVLGGLTLGLSLGGWIDCAGTGILEDGTPIEPNNMKHPLYGWHVRLHSVSETGVFVRLEYKNLGRKERIVLEVGQAIRLLDEVKSHGLLGLSDVFTQAHRRVVSTDLEVLERIARKFEKAHRLRTRIEALEIWLLLIDAIVALHVRSESEELELWNHKRLVIKELLDKARAANKRKRAKAS